MSILKSSQSEDGINKKVKCSNGSMLFPKVQSTKILETFHNTIPLKEHCCTSNIFSGVKMQLVDT